MTTTTTTTTVPSAATTTTAEARKWILDTITAHAIALRAAMAAAAAEPVVYVVATADGSPLVRDERGFRFGADADAARFATREEANIIVNRWNRLNPEFKVQSMRHIDQIEARLDEVCANIAQIEAAS